MKRNNMTRLLAGIAMVLVTSFATAEVKQLSVAEIVQYRSQILSDSSEIIKNSDHVLPEALSIESVEVKWQELVLIRLSSAFEGSDDICLTVNTRTEAVTVRNTCN